jgi:L-ribulose-5-phosphate 3-epimerase
METDFMNTVQKAMCYVRLFDSPFLQVYPDIGNIRNAAENYIDDIRCGAGHIVAAHLKETKDGIFRDLEYGQGRVDFGGSVHELRRLGVGMFTCEFWYDNKTDPLTYILRNKNYLEEHAEL